MNAWGWGDPTDHAKQQLDQFTYFRTTTQQRPHWLQWDAPNSPPKLPLDFDDNHPNLIHPSLNRLHSPSQTASGSNQPFCHNTFCRPTDVQTTTWLIILQTERLFQTSINCHGHLMIEHQQSVVVLINGRIDSNQICSSTPVLPRRHVMLCLKRHQN